MANIKSLVKSERRQTSVTTRRLDFRVIVEQDEDGIFVVSCPELPGCHSQGKTYEEALDNIKEAIELCLEVAAEDRSYQKKIRRQRQHPRLIGVVDVPVRVKSGTSL